MLWQLSVSNSATTAKLRKQQTLDWNEHTMTW